MPSALWPVRTYLFNLFTTTHAGTDTLVIDGPRVRNETPSQFLLVGSSGDLADDAVGRAEQAPSPYQGGWRDEAGEVDCAAVAWTGNADDLPAIRTIVEGIVDLSEAAVLADPRLGGLLTPANHRAELVRLDVREQHTDKGPFVEAVFTIAYTTTLIPD